MLIYLPSCAKVVCESLLDSKPMTFGGTWTGLRMVSRAGPKRNPLEKISAGPSDIELLSSGVSRKSEKRFVARPAFLTNFLHQGIGWTAST
jgi:hypothetical protein